MIMDSQSATSFEQLEGLPLQQVLLKLSNPGPLLATCRAAHRSVVQTATIEVSWFLRWAPVLAPHRPWQYAAITWRRLGGPDATLERLAAFMLACIAAQREAQHRQQGQHSLLLELQRLQLGVPQAGAAAAGAAGAPSSAPQQQKKKHYKAEERELYSPFPECLPLPSVVRQAQRQLQQGRALKALQLLCPGPPLLLYPYACQAGNLQLLVALVMAQGDSDVGPYPGQHFLLSCGVQRFLSIAQLCAFGAMTTGARPVLAWVLLTAGHTFRAERYLLQQLLRFACTRSNAACLQELLQLQPCGEPQPNGDRLRPWHQHLAMAAGRTDAWAADLVQLLLRALHPKQLAAKYMGPAYAAACRSDHAPVLQQLLDVAAKQPQQHALVLLRAVVQAENAALLQQLLRKRRGSDCSSGSDSGSGNSSSGSSSELRVPVLPVDDLEQGSHLASLLLGVLRGLNSNPPSSCSCLTDPQQGSRRAAMADTLWQALGEGGAAGFRQLIATTADRRGLLTAGGLPAGGAPGPNMLLWLASHGCMPGATGGLLPEGQAARVAEQCAAQRDIQVLTGLLQAKQQPAVVMGVVQGALLAAIAAAAAAGDLRELRHLAVFICCVRHLTGLPLKHEAVGSTKLAGLLRALCKLLLPLLSASRLMGDTPGARVSEDMTAVMVAMLKEFEQLQQQLQQLQQQLQQLQQAAGATATADSKLQAPADVACAATEAAVARAWAHMQQLSAEHLGQQCQQTEADAAAAAAAAASAAPPQAAAGGGGAGVVPLWQLAAMVVMFNLDPVERQAVQLMDAGLGTALLHGLRPGTSCSSAGASSSAAWAGGAPAVVAAGGVVPAAPPLDHAGVEPAVTDQLSALSPRAATEAAAAAAAGDAEGVAGACGVTAQEQAFLAAVFRTLVESEFVKDASRALKLSGWLQHRQDVLAWLLHPCRRQQLWGDSNNVVPDRVALATSAQMWVQRTGSYVEQLQQQQLRQHQQQLAAGVAEGFSPLPHFAAAAAELSRVLLLQPTIGLWPGQIGEGIACQAAGTSSVAHLERVKAMLGVVVGAPRAVLLRSWQLVLSSTCRRVTATGDIDLVALTLLYDARARTMLEHEGRSPDVQLLAPAGAGEAAWDNGMEGAQGGVGG